MDYKFAINNKTLNKNVNTYLKETDTNNDGEFTRAEVKAGIKAGTAGWVKPFITEKAMNSIMDTVDTNKDGKLSEDELDKYLQENYNIKLKDAKKMNFEQLGDYMNKNEVKKPKKK